MDMRSDSAIRAAIGGKGRLDIDRLRKLASQKTSNGENLNLHWLITGSGQALLSPRSESTASVILPVHDLRALSSALILALNAPSNASG